MKKSKAKSAKELADETYANLQALPFSFASSVVAYFLSDLSSRKQKEIRKLAKKLDTVEQGKIIEFIDEDDEHGDDPFAA